jgi:hypothetical protein
VFILASQKSNGLSKAYKKQNGVGMAVAYRAIYCKIIIGLFVLCIISACVKQIQAPTPTTPEIKPLELLLTDPQKDFSSTGSRTYDVKGVVRGGKAPYRISLEDKLKELNQEGSFTFPVNLKLGDNLFAVSVKDSDGVTLSNRFAITTVPAPLKIVLDENPPQKTTKDEILLKVTISGGWGNIELKVNDARVELGDIRQFSYPFKLSEGANKLQISAKDASGQSAVWPGENPMIINRFDDTRMKEGKVEVPVFPVRTKTKLHIIARKAGHEDNDKILFDLKSDEMKSLETIIKNGGKVVVAGKIGSKSKPEYLGEIVAMSQKSGLRVKVQLRTPHPNIRISLYNEFIITEQ